MNNYSGLQIYCTTYTQEAVWIPQSTQHYYDDGPRQLPVETFNYLDSLVTTNPDVNDGIVNGDDHIRGIKFTLKNTFPNVTGAITATQVDLNTVASWASGGAAKLKGAGAYFDTNATDGFKNTLAGDIDVVLQGVIAAAFQRVSGANFLKVSGGIQATGEIKGPGICPPGSTVIWWDSALPSDGLWAWANGQIISDAATRCPILLERWGSRFGGNGLTTMGVPDMREVVPVGNSTMGATTSPGLLASITASLRTTLGSLFGTDTVTLSKAQVPPLNFSGYTSSMNRNQSHRHAYSRPYTGGTADGGGYAWFQNLLTTDYTDYVDTNHEHTFSGTTEGGGGAHSSVQPSRTVNWIIRLG
jgi:microcystin-dependent protein